VFEPASITRQFSRGKTMTSFDNTFNNNPLNTNFVRPTQATPALVARIGVENAPALSAVSNLASVSNLDVVQFSPLTARESLQRSRFADLSEEQVKARVAGSLELFLDSPVSEILSNELPDGLKDNPRFAEIMSEKAVDFI
jgi:hypothetical protein